MTEQHTQDALEVIAYFQKLPALELQRKGGAPDGHIEQAVADLIREWRRMQHYDLPVATCTGLSRCDDNALFNVVGYCFDLLLQRVVPKNELRRQRRKEKRERYRLQRGVGSAIALAAAFGGAAAMPAAAGAEPASASG